MFGFKKIGKNTKAQTKLGKQYEQLLAQAMTAQRNGDIRRYSELSEEASKILQKIEALETTPLA
jgi:hypothetical protein